MPSEKEIGKVITILRREMQKYKDPALTQIGRAHDPFKVLISCILSLRTRDTTTEKASKRLYAIADTPGKMTKLSEQAIAKTIYPVSFYKTKASRIKKICQELIENYNGKVPCDFDTLMKFKGVGRKTANIVMVYGFNMQGIPVDIHVHVITNRLGWVKTKTPEKTESELRKLIPLRYWMELNELFVTHGQNICQTGKPKCQICPLQKYCRYYKKYG